MAPKKNNPAPAATETKPAAAPAAPAPKAAAAPVATEAAPAQVEVDHFSEVLAKLQGFSSELKEMIATVKILQKEYNKAKSAKGSKRSKKAAGGDGSVKRAPSGFAKPTALSDQLCEFLGVPKGSSLARTEVTRIINQYVKTHNLQDKADKRQIMPDAKLKGIMSIKEGDKLTYFNLQSYIKHHFIKA